ncbi:MAG TPA: hypothetical protein VMZ90_06590 [Vicinamibacterales bacterium]|nr:hypothetical protein [Vicinamibacterales bacterium]
MTARRVIQSALLTLLVAGGLMSTACASTRTVNQLLADPGRYRNDNVQISGEVVDSYSLANRGAYQIDDGTGRLWIVSEHGVPRKSARVTVKGTVREGFNLGSLGDAIRLPAGIAAGMVLMESSHKAKR